MPGALRIPAFPATLLCPDCESTLTHLNKVDTHPSGRDRRLATELVFGCEDCHGVFGIAFVNSKGATHVGVTR